VAYGREGDESPWNQAQLSRFSRSLLCVAREWTGTSCDGSCPAVVTTFRVPEHSDDPVSATCASRSCPEVWRGGGGMPIADAALAALREELTRYQELLDDKSHEHDTLAAAHERSQVRVACMPQLSRRWKLLN
jgi:hypothetical protein